MKFKLSFSRSGLSGLVERVLGQPLDKNEQISPWAQRPLSQSQLVYAALDSYVLLEVKYQACSTGPEGCDRPNRKFMTSCVLLEQ